MLGSKTSPEVTKPAVVYCVCVYVRASNYWWPLSTFIDRELLVRASAPWPLFPNRLSKQAMVLMNPNCWTHTLTWTTSCPSFRGLRGARDAIPPLKWSLPIRLSPHTKIAMYKGWIISPTFHHLPDNKNHDENSKNLLMIQIDSLTCWSTIRYFLPLFQCIKLFWNTP